MDRLGITRSSHNKSKSTHGIPRRSSFAQNTSPSLNPSDICNPSLPAPRLRALLQSKRGPTKRGVFCTHGAGVSSRLCYGASSTTVASLLSSDLSSIMLGRLHIPTTCSVGGIYTTGTTLSLPPGPRGWDFQNPKRKLYLGIFRTWFHTDDELTAALLHLAHGRHSTQQYPIFPRCPWEGTEHQHQPFEK